ncbi:MAG: amidohydrolase family protein [Gammaproteobacteria bacterium]|jgi:imidazolonepropionase-like amidohydrolase|nr:amidohydrolase family protein [Gammaproteobacteria bacterium]MBT5153807.1 amidohydrolase family protein [Gammaproteobacteria bacterium]MBT5684444.1 amidohydrolase family protein [Gammaproteobacteria bacterium]MBT5725691.1 amidohydrolase family protein [Gammaproteobacteria bacterium]MBT6584281.1 amidohydrolase family protein [Gammaproteobacteria bacterium]
MRKLCALLLCFILSEVQADEATLIDNVRVWDGLSEMLSESTNVLVIGDQIKGIGVDAPKSAVRIDGGGRTLMPGLIDAHVHINLQFLDSSVGVPGANQMTWEEIGARARDAIAEFLPSGFTTVRDLCGTGPGLRNLIDSGFISGPRMYISGACISQTSGHADFRMDSEAVTPNFGDSTLERLGITILADGVDEVLKATRNNLARGADFTKMMGGGGVSSDRDPIESVQGTLEEIGAMVLATGHYGTYGAMHAYHDRSVQRAVNAGIRSIEHGNLMVEPESFKMVADADVWLVPALGGFAKELMDHPYYGNPANPAHFKAKRVNDNGTNWVKLANLYQINMGFGTDIVVVGKRSSRNLRDYQITQWGESFGNLRTLKAMTSDNGKLMALTGTKNPYPNKLGVIEPGAYADLILVDGNPLEDLAVIGAVPSMFKTIPRDTPSVPSIRLVMKNGVVYKNTL